MSQTDLSKLADRLDALNFQNTHLYQVEADTLRAAATALRAAEADARDAARWREVLADEMAVRALRGSYDVAGLTREVDSNIVRRAALTQEQKT